MIDLIRDAKPWTKNQIRKRVESYIASIQTHGDEALLTRVNDAQLLGILPSSYDTSGADSYRNGEYLSRALEAGKRADRMAADNDRLVVLIGLQAALVDFPGLARLIDGEDALPELVEDESGDEVDNPDYVAAVGRYDLAVSVLNSASVDDWRLVAQRERGEEIGDPVELDLAVIRMLPTDDTLKAYVEGAELGTVDRRRSLEGERSRLIAALQPSDPVPPVE